MQDTTVAIARNSLVQTLNLTIQLGYKNCKIKLRRNFGEEQNRPILGWISYQNLEGDLIEGSCAVNAFHLNKALKPVKQNHRKNLLDKLDKSGVYTQELYPYPVELDDNLSL